MANQKTSALTVKPTFTTADSDYLRGVSAYSTTPVSRIFPAAAIIKGVRTPRVTTETSSATPTINTDNSDIHQVTALAAAITSFTTNLSGTPVNGQQLMIEVLDNGTARAITWGASFASGPATLPTTTILSKWLFVKFEYSTSRSKWICMATGSEQ